MSQRPHRLHSGLTAHAPITHNILHQPAAGRSKRPLEAPEREFDPLKHKKAKLTVDLLSRAPAVPSKQPSVVANAQPSQPLVARSDRPAAPLPTPARQPPVLTEHRKKVINGIRHELDRLQPNAVDTKEQGRKLRSQEATRFKSELAAYFPDYDEIIGNDPKEQRERHLFFQPSGHHP
jgi:hypothetical protein